MLVLGIDAHKRTHTVVAIDSTGRKLGEKITTATTTADHLDLLRWAEQFGTERRWAVEDCRHLSRRLERDLLAAGEAIVRVPPKMMANTRTRARTYGKSDPIDALAVARAALQEPDLPLRSLMAQRVRCGCWSIIATTWCRNAPGRRADCGGISTSSTRRGIRRRRR